MRIFQKIGIVVCFLFLAANGAQAQLEDIKKAWTTIGSAGTVDETDVNKVFFDRSIVQMGHVLITPSASSIKKRGVVSQQTLSAVVRYNLTPVNAFFVQCIENFPCPAIGMSLRYLAVDGGKVVAKLIEVDFDTGTESTLLTFNSSLFSASNSYHTKGVHRCGTFHKPPFDFQKKGYYIEATLTARAAVAVGSAAGIQMIKVTTAACPGGE
jgi:hypothetical protein